MAKERSKKKESKDDFLLFFGLLIFAIGADITDWLLGIGALSSFAIGFSRIIFWFTDKNSKLLNWMMAISASGEMIPVGAALWPGATGFIVTIWISEKLETKSSQAVIGSMGPAGATLEESGGLKIIARARKNRNRSPVGPRGEVKKMHPTNKYESKELEKRPSQQKEKFKAPGQKLDEDQFGKKYGPLSASGEVSQSAIAQPGSSLERQKPPQGTPYKTNYTDRKKPSGENPTNPVLRAHSRSQEYADESILESKNSVFDQYGNRAPTVPSKGPVASTKGDFIKKKVA